MAQESAKAGSVPPPMKNAAADDSAEAVLRRFRDRLTDDPSNLSEFSAVQRVRGDLSNAVQRVVRAGEGNKARLLGGCCAELARQWKTPVKDFYKLIVTSLKRRVTLRPYRQAVRRQHAAEAKTSDPHIRHFGLKAKRRFAPDM